MRIKDYVNGKPQAFSDLILKTETLCALVWLFQAAWPSCARWTISVNLGLLEPVLSEADALGFSHFWPLPLPMFSAQLCHNLRPRHLTVVQKSTGFESKGLGGQILLLFVWQFLSFPFIYCRCLGERKQTRQ